MSTLRNANTTTNASAAWRPADAASSAHFSTLEDSFNDLSLDRSPPPWSPHSYNLSDLSAQLSRSLSIDNGNNDNNNGNNIINNNNSLTQSAVHPITPPPPQLRPRSQSMLPPIPSLSSLPPSTCPPTLRSKTRPQANRAKAAKHRKDGKEGKPQRRGCAEGCVMRSIEKGATKHKKTTAAAGVTKKKKREAEGGLLHNQGLSKSALRRWIAEVRAQRRAREEGMSRAGVDGDAGEDMAVDQAEGERATGDSVMCED